MNLARQQEAFLARILHDDIRPGDAREEAGMDVYRNNYRAGLVEVLKGTFPRTLRWVGEDSFRAAAIHHLITCPPTGWTVDEAGRGFADTVDALFPNDPDVAELVWLEWAMHTGFVSRDASPLSPQEFGEASARFAEHDWVALKLDFLPGLQFRRVAFDLTALYTGLAEGAEPPVRAPRLPEPAWCLCWREDLEPTFVITGGAMGACLAAMQSGTSFGDMCARLLEKHGEGEAMNLAGEALRRWVELGLITGLRA